MVRPLARNHDGHILIISFGRSVHQLRHQDVLLSLLFQTLYDNPVRSPSISEGLIRGTIMSAFGTAQRNRDYLDSDPECQRLQARIRDSTLLIALEAMCLSAIVEIPSEEDGLYDDERGTGTILTSTDGILSLHLFLLDMTSDLGMSPPEEESQGVAEWPISILCLAWSVVLRSLDDGMQPSSVGFEKQMYVEFAERALRFRSGLFPWLEWVLGGPLLVEVGGVEVDGLNMARRKVVKGGRRLTYPEWGLADRNRRPCDWIFRIARYRNGS
jgi:nuclear pore complex protein Nup188